MAMAQREDWMLRPPPRPKPASQDEAETKTVDKDPDAPRVEGISTVKGGLVGSSSKPGALGSVVGDGGASWRLKRLKRLQQVAAQEGKTLEEVALGRGIDVAKLLEGATAHPSADAMAHLRAAKMRSRESRERPTARGGDYMADVGSSRSRMQKPDQARSVSWRRRGGGARQERSGGGIDRVLAGVAPQLNKFENDGSFMEAVAASEQCQGILQGGAIIRYCLLVKCVLADLEKKALKLMLCGLNSIEMELKKSGHKMSTRV